MPPHKQRRGRGKYFRQRAERVKTSEQLAVWPQSTLAGARFHHPALDDVASGGDVFVEVDGCGPDLAPRVPGKGFATDIKGQCMNFVV